MPTVPRVLCADPLQDHLVQWLYCSIVVLVSNTEKEGSIPTLNNLFYYVILSKDCHSESWLSPGSFLQDSWRKHKQFFLPTDQESYQESRNKKHQEFTLQ
jgi:hypothetical protein